MFDDTENRLVKWNMRVVAAAAVDDNDDNWNSVQSIGRVLLLISFVEHRFGMQQVCACIIQYNTVLWRHNFKPSWLLAR